MSASCAGQLGPGGGGGTYGAHWHGADHVLGDARLVAVDLRERGPGRYCRAIDPVQSGAGNLDETEPLGDGGHRLCEDEGHEDIDISEHFLMRASFASSSSGEAGR
jgi:hypothetical protein